MKAIIEFELPGMKQIDRWLIGLYIIILYLTYAVNKLIDGNFFN